MKNITGIHHVTAIASNAQRNYDFYVKILGLRFVKQTVNFDDPTSYHFYFGDKTGTPGSILTFFIWPNASKGREGIGQINSISFRIPTQSLGFWIHRLTDKSIKFKGPKSRFGEKYLSFVDPDGLTVELIADSNHELKPNWEANDIGLENAIIDIYGVTLWEKENKLTETILTQNLDFEILKTEENTTRYINNNNFIELRETGGFWDGVVGAGSIHHVAFSTPNDESENLVRESLLNNKSHPTEQIDRKYFNSIYFKEPGGALFEIATEKPGFLIDESEADLGGSLKLPEQYEQFRNEIITRLPQFNVN